MSSLPKADHIGGGPLDDAKRHLDGAMERLTIECFRATAEHDEERDLDWKPVDDFTIAEELERVDRAIGPKGQSMFASLGQCVRDAYVEIKAAREALDKVTP